VESFRLAMGKMKNESTCPACGAPLTFPGEGNRAVCVYCGYEADVAADSPAEVQAESMPEPVMDPQPIVEEPEIEAFQFDEPRMTPMPPPPPSSQTSPDTGGMRWARVGTGCIAGCLTAWMLGFACVVLGALGARLSESRGMQLPVWGLEALIAPVVVVIGLIVFLVIAFTGKKRS
jgi:hypothetical protein